MSAKQAVENRTMKTNRHIRRSVTGAFFSMQGRYNRARYFWSQVGIYGSVLVGAFIVGIIMGLSGSSAEDAETVGGLLGIGGAVLAAFPIVKRLHDLNRPGTHYWLLLVPLYGLYLGLVLLFQTGTRGPNEFGPDQLLGQQQAEPSGELDKETTKTKEPASLTKSEWSQYVRPRLGRLGRLGISIGWNPEKAEQDYHALQQTLKATLAKGDKHEALKLLRAFAKRHPMSHEKDIWSQIIALEKETSKVNQA